MPPTRHDAPRPPLLPILAALVAFATTVTGCAAMRADQAKGAYYGDALKAYRYRDECSTLWPSVLRLLSSKGYPLVGADRAAVSDSKQGEVAQFLSGGHQMRTESGKVVSMTDWNAKGTKYRATGTRGDPDGCHVSFTIIKSDPLQPQQEASFVSYEDWSMELDLLRRVDPDAAARLDAGAPKS